MYFLHIVRTKTKLIHLKISFQFYFFVWGLGRWFRVFWFYLHSCYLIFFFLRILVYGGHCPLIFNSKTNKRINMHWIFSMAFLVVDHFGECHFSRINIYYLFSHFFSFYLHHHHFLFYSSWL